MSIHSDSILERWEGVFDESKEKLEACEHNFALVYDQLQKCLAFIRGMAKVDGELKNPSDIWELAETIQDGIDYADHSNAKIARALLKELNEGGE